MKIQEAYKILDLPETAAPEEAKKKYRQLTKIHHPDINKESGAEDKFKKINEAYQCIQNGKGNEREEQSHNWSSPFSNPFSSNPFSQQQFHNPQPIEFSIDLSFKEAVLGHKKAISISRKNKCQKCNGQGTLKLDNGCKKCSGKGQVINKHGNQMFIQTCPDCKGRTNTEKCQSCAGNGTQASNMSASIQIPAGVINGNVLRLEGMGNYAGSFMGIQDQFTDAFCTVNVKEEPGLSLIDGYVMSKVTLSLLDALQGTKQSVKTIFGNKEIDIPPQIKNKDEILIPRVGIGGNGDQKVIIHIDYPTDVSKLIETLRSE